LKPSFKALNPPSNKNQTVRTNHKKLSSNREFSINHKKLITDNKTALFLLVIFLLSFSIIAIPPEKASASVKRHKVITRAAAKPSKTSKSDSSSGLSLYFEKRTGNRIKDYNEYSSVIKKNETIVELLKPYGLTHADIFEFAKQNRKTFNLKELKAGQRYSIISEKNSGEKARYLIYEKAAKKYVILPIDLNRNNDTGALQAADNNNDQPSTTKNSLKQSSRNVDNPDGSSISKSAKNSDNQRNSEIKIRQVSGIIKTSLHKTAARMGLNRKLINQLSEIFKNTSALSNLHKGDIVQVAYQEQYVNGKRVKTGVITAAVITSRNRSYSAYRFTYNGKHGYYDENGNSLTSSFLKAPLKYREISSGFSTRRFHPIKHMYQPHPGIDYAAPKGTPIKSVGDGTVIFKGYAASAGNYMKIRHPGTGISEYMHMSRFHPSIKVNKKVSKGDIIGYVGATGYATGPHLDLRFIVNNRYVDYRKLKLPHGDPLPRKFRNVFLQHVAMVNKQWNRTARRELSMNSINPFMEQDYSAQHKL